MKAEEIRKSANDVAEAAKGFDHERYAFILQAHQAQVLTEIAAQLAELNEHMAAVAAQRKRSDPGDVYDALASAPKEGR